MWSWRVSGRCDKIRGCTTDLTVPWTEIRDPQKCFICYRRVFQTHLIPFIQWPCCTHQYIGKKFIHEAIDSCFFLLPSSSSCSFLTMHCIVPLFGQKAFCKHRIEKTTSWRLFFSNVVILSILILWSYNPYKRVCFNTNKKSNKRIHLQASMCVLSVKVQEVIFRDVEWRWLALLPLGCRHFESLGGGRLEGGCGFLG